MSTAARIYARALYDAATDQDRVGKVAKQLGELRGAVEESDELRSLLANPEVDSRVKGDVLARLAEGAEELVVNVLRLLAEKGRAGQLDEIAAAFESLVAAEEQVLDVELTTALDLSDKQFDHIVGRIEKSSGRKVQATRSVDPDLIGGIVLQAGSMRLDASVRGRLERLRNELTTARS